MSGWFDPLEAAVRRALEFDPDTRERIRGLDGRVAEISLTGIEQSLCVTIDGEAVSFSKTPEREPDLRLTGSPFAFGRYVLAPDHVDITESGISIEGDIGLAQRFAAVFRQIDIDWEEWLSRYTGDVAAFRVGRLVESLRAWADDGRHQFRQDMSEYLQEEIRVLAPSERVRTLMNDIDATRSDVERLIQRVRRLQNTP